MSSNSESVNAVCAMQQSILMCKADITSATKMLNLHFLKCGFPKNIGCIVVCKCLATKTKKRFNQFSRGGNERKVGV